MIDLEFAFVDDGIAMVFKASRLREVLNMLLPKDEQCREHPKRRRDCSACRRDHSRMIAEKRWEAKADKAKLKAVRALSQTNTNRNTSVTPYMYR